MNNKQIMQSMLMLIPARLLSNIKACPRYIIVSWWDPLWSVYSHLGHWIISLFADESTRTVHSVSHNAFLHAPEAEMLIDEGRHLAVAAAF